MLKKELRVKRERDFSLIYKKGGFIGGSFFNINYLSNKTDSTRLGVVISKKTEKKAVMRNAIKRKVKEAMRQLYPDVKNGHDIVINIKKEALKLSVEEIKEELKRQLNKKNLLKG